MIRPANVTSIVVLLVSTDFINAPSPSNLTRFAGEKDGSGVISGFDLSDDAMPERDEMLEMISCIDLGLDDSNNHFHAVMVQRDESYANMVGLAISAVNYAMKRNTDQVATAAVDLIGGDPSKLRFIGTQWTTIVVRTDAAGRPTVRNVGQMSVNKLDDSTILVYETKNPGQIIEIDSAETLSSWFVSTEELERYAVQAHPLNGEHFKKLYSMDGSFLRRGDGKMVVISDGLTNARFDFVAVGDGGQRRLEFNVSYVGRLEFAINDRGVIDVDSVLQFDGTPGVNSGLSLDRIELSKLPASTRDVITT